MKFKDSELIGLPIRLGIGEKSLAKGSGTENARRTLDPRKGRGRRGEDFGNNGVGGRNSWGSVMPGFSGRLPSSPQSSALESRAHQIPALPAPECFALVEHAIRLVNPRGSLPRVCGPAHRRIAGVGWPSRRRRHAGQRLRPVLRPRPSFSPQTAISAMVEKQSYRQDPQPAQTAEGVSP